ncbi:hypothetical protein AL046_28415 [Pseudomonas syringae pv. avii]|nr:hypothetical protein AL046_28415 [Pseudomonas syringae pv. avii]
MFSCSKSEQKQLNTWVSFQSAEQPLLGQFSVSGNNQKKDDIFKAKYKDHWMTWSGQIVLLESDEVSLNIDRVGTQDLKVEFADKAAGYNLAKGGELKVRFLMKSAGGCFLPFSGREATVVR